MEIQTGGQRLNYLRVTLLNNATQKELCGSYSRNRISQVENGGTLKADFAEVIAENVKLICKEKNIKLDIKDIFSWLMESQEDQVKKYFIEQKKILMELRQQEESEDIFKGVLQELIEICEKYNIEYNAKIEVYYIAIEFHYGIKEYHQSMQRVAAALKLAKKEKSNNDIIRITSKQLKIYIKTKMYLEVISKYKWLISFLENASYDKHYLIDTMINTILAYKNLNQYSELLELSNKLITEFELTNTDFIGIKNTEANYYFGKQEYEKAKKIYEEIRDISAESNLTDMFAVTTCNLAELSLEQNNINEANNYIESALKIKNISTKNYILQMYYIALKIKIRINDLKDVQVYFLECFRLGCKSKNKEIVIEACKEAFYFYLKEKLSEKILFLLETIQIEASNNKILDREVLDIYVEAAYYFKDTNRDISEKIMCVNYNLIKDIQKK